MSNIMRCVAKEEMPMEDKHDITFRLSKKYNNKNEIDCLVAFASKYFHKIGYYEFYEMPVILSIFIGSYDLLNKVIKYLYTIETCKYFADDLINRSKNYILKQINENTLSMNRVEEGDFRKAIEEDINNFKKRYCLFDNLFKKDIDLSVLSCEDRDKLALGMIESAFSSSYKKNRKIFNEIFTIIEDFYESKKNFYKDIIEKNLKNLTKILDLTSFEASYLISLSVLGTEMPHLFQYCSMSFKNYEKRFMLTKYENDVLGSLHNSFSWVKFYLIDEDAVITDYIIHSEDIKIKDDINICDYPADMQEKIKSVKKLINNYEMFSPLNILLWGETGCGKSTLVELLQKEIPSKKFIKINNDLLDKNNKISSVYEINKEEEGDFSTKASLRMNTLRICSSVAKCNQYVFVMDEADDVLNSSYGKDSYLTGKKEINELLEDLRSPVIWITNHKNTIDTSTCRRFQYSIKFEKLSAVQREKIWKKQIKLTKTENLMKNIDVKKISSKYNITPGVVSTVLSDLKVLNPKKDEIESTIESLIKNHLDLVDENEIKNEKTANCEKYDISGLNIKSQFSIDKIVPALNKFEIDRANGKNKSKNLCLLFNGHPGTGKTEFAKYIARELNKELKYMVYGDLASMWVGETEHHIQKAFEEAEKNNAILFFDEADSLINSRESARYSWEVTRTNEVLTRMERFKGIFIASTNFLKSLDNAAMRRFQIKIEFDYLDDEGKAIFYERFFNKKIIDKNALSSINMLAPGDFKAVKDKLVLFDDNPSEEVIINELKNEVKYKKSNNSIGFTK